MNKIVSGSASLMPKNLEREKKSGFKNLYSTQNWRTRKKLYIHLKTKKFIKIYIFKK